MTYKYLAYGIPIISSIELTALIENTENLALQPITVSEARVPENLEKTPLETKPFSVYNENEFLYNVPEVARYYVRDGKEIIIERLDGNWNEVLLHFYANCMAVALFQRNLIPFHVSGVFVDKGRVLLFAAPSRNGKSTTSVMLQQRGYPLFTDDTAILFVENGKCYAQASYPMIRLWQNTIEKQQVLHEADKFELCYDIELDKYGFMFHEQFVSNKVEVVGVVFLDADGNDMKIEKLKPSIAIQQLGNNIYRKQWLNGMKKQLIQFKHLTSIVNAASSWKAYRPKGQPTFDNFSEMIEDQIINPINERELVTQ
ncbi:MAG: hypothetical protein MUF43_01165 [Flavobacterium sp.]|jgi:hypothetical protein|nr:hypothetical protein [Flavobacterium sp.]